MRSPAAPPDARLYSVSQDGPRIIIIFKFITLIIMGRI